MSEEVERRLQNFGVIELRLLNRMPLPAHAPAHALIGDTFLIDAANAAKACSHWRKPVDGNRNQRGAANAATEKGLWVPSNILQNITSVDSDCKL